MSLILFSLIVNFVSHSFLFSLGEKVQNLKGRTEYYCWCWKASIETMKPTPTLIPSRWGLRSIVFILCTVLTLALFPLDLALFSIIFHLITL